MNKLQYLCLFLLVAIMSIPIVAQQNRRPVCHLDDTYYQYGSQLIPVGHEITVADPAIESHIAHGDTETYVLKTHADGTVFCTSDVDLDGFADYEDVCPLDAYHDAVGDPCNHDEDSDGLSDDVDLCPTEFGSVSNNGCPQFDSDGDGVTDDQDGCPDTPDLSQYVEGGNGYVNNFGCIYLPGIDLRGEDLSGLNLSHADLSGAYLTYANLSDANLFGAVLNNTYMGHVNLRGAELSYSGLYRAIMNGADLSFANLNYVYLGDTWLMDANLSNANLHYATLQGANLTGVIWDNTICPDGTNSNDNGGVCPS